MFYIVTSGNLYIYVLYTYNRNKFKKMYFNVLINGNLLFHENYKNIHRSRCNKRRISKIDIYFYNSHFFPISVCNTQIHNHSLFWLGTSIIVARAEDKLLYILFICHITFIIKNTILVHCRSI